MRRIFLLSLIASLSLVSFSQTSVKGITLLIDFEDLPADLSVDRINDLLNGEGYTEPAVPSSVRDYWKVQSRDSIDLTYDIFGYYRAAETFATYETMDWTIVNDIVTAALDSVVANNPDYDWDGLTTHSAMGLENEILSVNVITTGWIPGSGGAHWSTDWTAPNGYSLYGFTVQPLTSMWDPDFVRLFTICHEIGHAAWGFPDTYDYDGSSFGTGFYSVMSGNQVAGEVEPIGAPFFRDAGWVDAIEIMPNSSYSLKQDGKSVAIYFNPADDKEYFIIEACMSSTPGNAAFPVERGLVIWHVDENVTTLNTLENMTFEEHYEYSIEQADGNFDLENGVNQGDAGDIYVEGSEFNSSTIPNTNWWNGDESGLDINSITFLADNTIRFCNGECSDLGLKTTLSKFQFTLYPTENNGQFFIEIPDGLNDDELVFSISNSAGQIFQTIQSKPVKGQVEIALNEDYTGMIFISIKNITGENYGVQKAVIR